MDVTYQKFELLTGVDSPSTLGASPTNVFAYDFVYSTKGKPSKTYTAACLLDLVAQNTCVGDRLNARTIVWERFVLIALGAMACGCTQPRDLKHYLDEELGLILYYA